MALGLCWFVAMGCELVCAQLEAGEAGLCCGGHRAAGGEMGGAVHGDLGEDGRRCDRSCAAGLGRAGREVVGPHP